MSPRWRVEQGDCLEVMRTLEASSVDAIVTDPPAGISFMGKKWDGDHGGRDQWIARFAEIAAECLRVIKPGGHALVWALPRTSHWTATAWEDGGWEVRDRVLHIFGSGFPKSLDVSKALDREAGAEQEPDDYSGANNLNAVYGKAMGGGVTLRKGTPATAAAIQWAGWGTALKPACEDWWLLRKPLGGQTVAANVREFGTGAINVGACRIGTDIVGGGGGGSALYDGGLSREGYDPRPVVGRWPANLLHDGSPEVLAGFPDDAGRYFYCAKASREDREAGLREAGLREAMRNDGRETEIDNPYQRGMMMRNHHPTVKPTELMRWLVRLVTPPVGLVLDPFTGSGSTGRAAVLEGARFIGIEREAEYVAIARARIAEAETQPDLFDHQPMDEENQE